MSDQVLKSNADASVNFVTQKDVGYLEARYVRRRDHYVVVYLSSQTGCNRGCKFCHLTATGQTKYKDASREDYLNQAKDVLSYYKNQSPAQELNYNFMSRGEALANENLLNQNHLILDDLTNLAIEHDLTAKFNVSTIMPKTLKDRELFKIFRRYNPTIYYSLYSLNETFRKQWMPGAMDPNKALDNLKRYQKVTNKIINLHWAFIEGENDSLEDLKAITDLLDQKSLVCNFNVVRYNPFSGEEGKESSVEIIQRNYEFLQKNIPGRVKIIDRVGFDVKASCGMFIR